MKDQRCTKVDHYWSNTNRKRILSFLLSLSVEYRDLKMWLQSADEEAKWQVVL